MLIISTNTLWDLGPKTQILNNTELRSYFGSSSINASVNNAVIEKWIISQQYHKENANRYYYTLLVFEIVFDTWLINSFLQ